MRSSATLQIAIEKLRPNLKEKWWFYVDETNEDRPDLCLLENWLSRISFVYEGMSQPAGERKEYHRRNANKTKQFSKTSNFSASSNVKEAQATIIDHCPLANGTHKIWIRLLFKNLNMNDRYAAVRKQRLCYGCLGKGHAIKYCKVNACGINGYNRKHNRLLHSENQMNEGHHAVNVSAATISQSNEVTSFLQIVPVSIKSGSNRLNTFAFLDSGSTVSFVDRSVNEKLRAECTDVTLNKAGIRGTKDFKTEMVCIKIKGPHSKSTFDRRVCTSVYFIRNHKPRLPQAEAKLQPLERSPKQNFQPDGLRHHSRSRCLRATETLGLQYRNTKWTFCRSNRVRMGSQWTYDGKEKTKCLSFRLHRRYESGWEHPKMVGYGNLCFQN